MGTTEQLARFLAETESSRIPEEALDAATTGLMDAVGTALVANIQELGKIITQYTDEIGGTPTCRVIGTSIKTSPPNAALANGTLGHADDYDDVGGFGHPAVILMPTVLAIGEQMHKSGREVLEAYALGYEVGARIGMNIGGDHYGRGWHSTSTIGTMASAAAASRLMGLDVAHTRTALGIAASLASGVQANFGTMTKPLHPGNAARSGVLAANLASKGYTANQDVIEAPLGYVAVFGDQQVSLGAMTRHLGTAPYLIYSPGGGIKEWPCCYGNHGAIPLATALVSKYEITPDQVESVEFIGAFARGFLNRPDAHTYFGGKFSLQFNIAAAIVDGGLTYDTFSDEKVNDPAIQAMMKKVTLSEDPMRASLPARLHTGGGLERAQTMAIRLKDGREVGDSLDGITNSLRGHQVDIKFEANASKVLSSEQAKKALGLLRDLKSIKDVSEVMDAVTLN